MAEETGALDGVSQDFLVPFLAALVDQTSMNKTFDDAHVLLRGLFEFKIQLKMIPTGSKDVVDCRYLDVTLSKPMPPIVGPASEFAGSFLTSSWCGLPKHQFAASPEALSFWSIPSTNVVDQSIAWLLVVLLLIHVMMSLRRVLRKSPSTVVKSVGGTAGGFALLAALFKTKTADGEQDVVRSNHIAKLRIHRAQSLMHWFKLLVGGIACVEAWRFFNRPPVKNELDKGMKFILNTAAPSVSIGLIVALLVSALAQRINGRCLDLFNMLLALTYSSQFVLAWPHALPQLNDFLFSLQFLQGIIFGNSTWSSALLVGVAVSEIFAILRWGLPFQAVVATISHTLISIAIIILWDKAMHVEVLHAMEMHAQKHLLSRFMAASFDANIEFELAPSGTWVVVSADSKAKAFFLREDMIGLSSAELTGSQESLEALLKASLTASDGPALMRTISLNLDVGQRRQDDMQRSFEVKVSTCCGPKGRISMWFSIDSLSPSEAYMPAFDATQVETRQLVVRKIGKELCSVSEHAGSLALEDTDSRACSMSGIIVDDPDNSTVVTFRSQLVDGHVGGQVTHQHDHLKSQQFKTSLAQAIDALSDPATEVGDVCPRREHIGRCYL